MKYFEELNLKQKIIIIIIPLIMIITIVSYAIMNMVRNSETQEDNFEELEYSNLDNEIDKNEDSNELIEKHIIVYVAGEVNHEGLVDLIEGERISDAITKAGGLKENANISEINMAYQMQDGEKLFIPSKVKEEKLKMISQS